MNTSIKHRHELFAMEFLSTRPPRNVFIVSIDARYIFRFDKGYRYVNRI